MQSLIDSWLLSGQKPTLDDLSLADMDRLESTSIRYRHDWEGEEEEEEEEEED